MAGPHELHDRFSLAIHERVAERIQQDPGLLEAPRARMAAWTASRDMSPLYIDAWNALLNGPLERLIATLEDPGEWATALRHTSPFAGIVDVATRERILRDVRAELASKAARPAGSP